MGPNTTFAYTARLQRLTDFSFYACVVSFRGTMNFRNILTDMTALLVPGFHVCDGCFVHDGFLGMWNSMKDDVVTALASSGCRPGSQQDVVYVTGHSLGAAMATLGMYGLAERGFQVRQSYVFASPRVGGPVWANRFHERLGPGVPLFRVSNGKDPVVHLATWGTFHHVGSEAYYPSNDPNEYVVCGDSEDRSCANRFDLMGAAIHWQHHCRSPVAESGCICKFPSVHLQCNIEEASC